MRKKKKPSMLCVTFLLTNDPSVMQKSDTFKDNPRDEKLIKRCSDCEKFAKLWLQLKTCEE
jgi:hypothetical protein